MKRLLPLLCAVALLTASCNSGSSGNSGTEAAPVKGPKVIVLGIDGGTWTVIEPMMEKGELPNLKKLYDSGLHGILESRPPILSPVVWTTIFTGFGHAKHGVKDWKTSQSVNRRVSAIWEILREKKMSVNVFNVPATWPPDPIPGVMLSGFPLSGATHGGNTGEMLTREQLEAGKLTVAYRDNAIAVRDAFDKLEVGKWSPWIDGKVASRPSFRGTFRVYRFSDTEMYVTPLYRTDEGLLISEPKELRGEMARKLGEPYIPEGPGWSRWADEKVPVVLADHLTQVFSIQSQAAAEYAGGDWRLFLFVMTLVDRVSHPYWGYAHPENFPELDPAKAAKFASAVPDSYRRTDEELGKILAKVKGEHYVMVVSDHGFQSSNDPKKAIGTHNPDGILLVAGPGIKPKTALPKFIEDVTPTVLYLLGMPTGQDMDGKVFSEVVEMIGRKPETIPTYETGGRDSTDEPVDSDTWESLKGLGYVDGAPPRAADKDKVKDKAGAGAGAGAKKPAPQKKPGKDEPGMAPGKPGARNIEPRQPAEKAPGANAPADGAPGVPKAGDALEDWPDDPDHDH